jgi:scyllo-inositol 2-dehydrogenase (NADP+)
LIDQALQLVDSEPDTIFSDFQYRVWDTDVESFVKCLIRFQNQLLYEINISSVSQISKPRWRVLGELGALVKQEIDFDEKAKVRTRMEGFTADMEIESVRAEWRDYYTNISQVFNEGAELAVKPEEARKVISLIESAIKSAETGESIEVSPA